MRTVFLLKMIQLSPLLTLLLNLLLKHMAESLTESFEQIVSVRICLSMTMNAYR